MVEIAEFIDWTPFFHSWEMKGSYPKILDDKERGDEAKKLFEDAQEMLKKIINEKSEKYLDLLLFKKPFSIIIFF